MQPVNHNKFTQDVYDATIGHSSIPAPSRVEVFNQVTCMMAAYMLFVVPKEAHLKAFAGAVSLNDLPSYTKFQFTDGSGNPWTEALDKTLNKLRNGMAHANFAVIPNASRLRLWNYPINSMVEDFSAGVDIKDFMTFAEEYQKAWVAWANKLP